MRTLRNGSRKRFTADCDADSKYFISTTSHGDDIQYFDTMWDNVLLSTSKIPIAMILESLCKMRIRPSDQLQTVLDEQEFNQDRSMHSYQKMKTMVKRHIEQKIRTRIFQARNERIETGVLVRRCLQLPPRRQ